MRGVLPRAAGLAIVESCPGLVQLHRIKAQYGHANKTIMRFSNLSVVTASPASSVTLKATLAESTKRDKPQHQVGFRTEELQKGVDRCNLVRQSFSQIAAEAEASLKYVITFGVALDTGAPPVFISSIALIPLSWGSCLCAKEDFLPFLALTGIRVGKASLY